jgi:hypothetical protein
LAHTSPYVIRIDPMVRGTSQISDVTNLALPFGVGRTRGSHAGYAVDSFAEEVGVAVVPGVLRDHVHHDPAK